MINYLVFREEGLQKKQLIGREKHNERTAEKYNNNNIKLEKSVDNIYFKKPSKSYEKIIDDYIADGTITTKGLKKDAEIVSEILIAVNRKYWIGKSTEEIEKFFKAVHDYLTQQFGDDMVISSVVHMDEWSEEDGEMIRNPHMHFLAIPTVEKHCYYSKRSKQYRKIEMDEGTVDPHDVRLLKSIEKQISHSKFFASQKEEHKLVYSYAVWQDNLLDVIHKNGFMDIQRGSSGQKAPHLHPMAYKQLMSAIDDKTSEYIEEINVKEEKESYQVEKSSLNRIYDLQHELAKGQATYELAVKELEYQQTKLLERQNRNYIAEKNYDELTNENQRLRCENEKLAKQIKKLINDFLLQNSIFKMIYNCLKAIYDTCLENSVVSGDTITTYIEKAMQEETIYKKSIEKIR